MAIDVLWLGRAKEFSIVMTVAWIPSYRDEKLAQKLGSIVIDK